MSEAFWITINLHIKMSWELGRKGGKCLLQVRACSGARKLRSILRTAKRQAELGLGEECNTIPSRAITMEIKRNEERCHPSLQNRGALTDHLPTSWGPSAPGTVTDWKDSNLNKLHVCSTPLLLPNVSTTFFSSQVPDTFPFFSGEGQR